MYMKTRMQYANNQFCTYHNIVYCINCIINIYSYLHNRGQRKAKCCTHTHTHTREHYLVCFLVWPEQDAHNTIPNRPYRYQCEHALLFRSNNVRRTYSNLFGIAHTNGPGIEQRSVCVWAFSELKLGIRHIYKHTHFFEISSRHDKLRVARHTFLNLPLNGELGARRSRCCTVHTDARGCRSCPPPMLILLGQEAHAYWISRCKAALIDKRTT